MARQKARVEGPRQRDKVRLRSESGEGGEGPPTEETAIPAWLWLENMETKMAPNGTWNQFNKTLRNPSSL